ncbi:ribonuclease H-like domain-containing protein, partial [Cyathus striatus]
CFPRIINLACQAFLDELKTNPHAPRLYAPPATSDPPATPNYPRASSYAQSLTKDLVGTCRNLVAVCRASGQRRKQLEDIIVKGNTKGYWYDGNSTLPVLQLLRDCDTRWSSTHQMICRVLQLYPVSVHILNLEQPEYQFTDDDLGVLQDIDQVLEVPHKVQELLSAEKTPTLSFALPLYEVLLEKWRILQNTIPELSHYIGVGISKIEEYISLARSTRIYVHAMVLNPAIKFKWMKDNWPPERVNEARSWVLESKVVSQSAQAVHTQMPMTPSYMAVVHAAQSQSRGLSNICSLDVSKRRRQSAGQTPVHTATPSANLSQQESTLVLTTPLQRTSSQEELEEQEAQELAEDRRIVERELENYEAEGISGLCIVSFWEIHEVSSPLLFHIAMDALPAQASSVSCEYLFEALQILKFSFKQERLTFTDNIQLAKPEDYCISGPVMAYAAQELLEANRLDELEELISNAQSEGYPAPIVEYGN